MAKSKKEKQKQSAWVEPVVYVLAALSIAYLLYLLLGLATGSGSDASSGY